MRREIEVIDASCLTLLEDVLLVSITASLGYLCDIENRVQAGDQILG
jgi:hypothetical protein